MRSFSNILGTSLSMEQITRSTAPLSCMSPRNWRFQRMDACFHCCHGGVQYPTPRAVGDSQRGGRSENGAIHSATQNNHNQY